MIPLGYHVEKKYMIKENKQNFLPFRHSYETKSLRYKLTIFWRKLRKTSFVQIARQKCDLRLAYQNSTMLAFSSIIIFVLIQRPRSRKTKLSSRKHHW